jgi:hypothetical protein
MVIGATIPLSGGVFLETTAVKDSLLLTSVLQTALLTSDVTVSTANSSGTGTGVISVLSPLLWATSRNLSLNADSDIQIKSSITGINGALNLTAGGAIVQTTSPIDAMAVSGLNAIAAGSITLDNNANTIGGSVALAASGGSVTLTAVNVNLGASNAAGAMTVTAYNGDLSVNGSLAAGGNITLQSSKANGTLTIASGQAVSASAGNVSLVADKMNLLGSASVSSTHALSLQPYQSSVNVLVGGSAADASGTLGLSEAELQRMSVPAMACCGRHLVQQHRRQRHADRQRRARPVRHRRRRPAAAVAGGRPQHQQRRHADRAGRDQPADPADRQSPRDQCRHDLVLRHQYFAGKMTLAGGTLNAARSAWKAATTSTSAPAAPAAARWLSNSDLNSVNATQLNVSVNSSHGGTAISSSARRCRWARPAWR